MICIINQTHVLTRMFIALLVLLILKGYFILVGDKKLMHPWAPYDTI